MMLIKSLLLVLIGLAAGGSIAGGVFAFIIMIGVLPRLAGRTHTGWAYWQYENAVIVGGLIGNLATIFSLKLPIGYVGMGLFGLFAGMYVGCFAMALAEVLNVFPVFSRRIHLKEGMPYMVVAMALGKSLGAIYQLCIPIWQK